MKKITVFISCLFCFCISQTQAQYSKYIIRLKDKANSPFSLDKPGEFLSERSLQRRTQQNIVIDETDLPVSKIYIDSIQHTGNVNILNVSKWLNQVCIQTIDAEALVKINGFSFVEKAIPVMKPVMNVSALPKFNEKFKSPATLPVLSTSLHNFDYGATYPQIHIHQGEFLHNRKLAGEGMLIAVFDAGFFRYTSIGAFDSLRINNQVMETYDFVKNEKGVAEDNSHGMFCLSILAANSPGKYVGSCAKANYLLYRTEDVATESLIEEQNWIAAAEKADSLGADVFTTSLGYTTFDNPTSNHTYQDLDGNTTMIARASDLAATKGILSVISAGNSGDKQWHYISTPADADSALTVGAVSVTGEVAAFSSYGPSADGQVKPTVASVGENTAVISSANNVIYGDGTSFSGPNMAGLITCLWQAYKEFTNMDIIEAVKQSSTKYNSPDDRVGYGLPDMKNAFVILNNKLFNQNVNIANCKATITFSAKGDTAMYIDLERKLKGETDFSSIYKGRFTSGFAKENFMFEDDLTNAASGEVSYRFKQTIGIDTTYYIDSVRLSYANTCLITKQNIKISPNPAKSNIKVEVSVTTPSKIRVEVFNYTGQKMYTAIRNQSAGKVTETIPAGRFAKGYYFVSVYINDKKVIVKQVLKD